MNGLTRLARHLSHSEKGLGGGPLMMKLSEGF